MGIFTAEYGQQVITSAKNTTHLYSLWILHFLKNLKSNVLSVTNTRLQLSKTNNLLYFHEECAYKIALKNHAVVSHILYF